MSYLWQKLWKAKIQNVCLCEKETPRERERERENSNSKTLFYKDCSSGSAKDRQTDKQTETDRDRKTDREWLLKTGRCKGPQFEMCGERSSVCISFFLGGWGGAVGRLKKFFFLLQTCIARNPFSWMKYEMPDWDIRNENISYTLSVCLQWGQARASTGQPVTNDHGPRASKRR